MSRRARHGRLGQAWILCSVLVGCQPSASASDPTPSAPSVETEHDATPAVRSGQVCGVCYAHNWQDDGALGYGSPTSEQSLREVRALGVTSVSLTSFGWMRNARAVEVVSSDRMRASETLDRMRAEAANAREQGASIMVKPHLWLGGGDWRGEIDPDPAAGGWDAWFASYRTFLLEHARFAEEVDAEWFVVGVELVTATRERPDLWRALIGEVRTVYSGALVYAANWDEAEAVTFWDALDAIGVQMFAPLRTDVQPLASLEDGARAWLARYEAIATRFDRPLILTEVGVMNREGGTVRPWEWPDRVRATRTEAGDAEQAAYYAAIGATFGQSERVAGMYWWKWFTNPDTNEEGPVGFDPRGKPAASVLGALCGGAS